MVTYRLEILQPISKIRKTLAHAESLPPARSIAPPEMNRRLRLAYLGSLVLIASALTWFGLAPAHSGSGLTLNDGNAVFVFDTGVDTLYRIEASSDLNHWQPIRTVARDGATGEYSEPLPPGAARRFFRAVALEPGSGLTGDYLATDAGEVLIHPVDHASFVMQWDGKTIYNDPVGGAGAFDGIPPADLILVGHSHGDHFSASTLSAVRAGDAAIVAPQDVFDRMSSTLQGQTTVLANGGSTSLLGLTIEAVPAYNGRHPEGRDNGYVVTIGGKRIYMSGDTEDISEMRALQNIDVAFLSMNVPFTMSVDQAASAIREFKPKAIYPYHYRNQNGTFADLERLRQLVGDDVGVEVRVRDWYP